MANRSRVPATHKMPRLELLEIECVSVTIVRDNAGKIIGTGRGEAKHIHNAVEFAEYLEICRKEIAEGNKSK